MVLFGGEPPGGFGAGEETETHYAGGSELEAEGDAPDCEAGFYVEGYAHWNRFVVSC